MEDNITCGSLFDDDYPITITIPGYKEDFKLSIITIIGTDYRRFAIMDNYYRIVYIIAHTRAEALIKLNEFLKDKDEIDLKMLKDE